MDTPRKVMTMMNVDAPSLTLSHGSVVCQPDIAEVTVVYRTESANPSEGLVEHQRLHSKLEQQLGDSGSTVVPVSHATERKKLLKKGVFGQGQHSVLRTQMVVRLPLAEGWSFWDRVRRAQDLRNRLNAVSDQTDGLQVSPVRWVLQDRRPGELKAHGALREAIQSQASALGACVVEIRPAVCTVAIEGPTRAVFAATAGVVLRIVADEA